jgi:hypothetical protein
MTDTRTILEEDPPRPRIETLPLAVPRPRSTSSLSPAQPHMGDEPRQPGTDEGRRHSMLTRAVRETTRIEPRLQREKTHAKRGQWRRHAVTRRRDQP